MDLIDYLAFERVSVEKNVIKGVHLIGLQARNSAAKGRAPYKYAEAALKDAVTLYDNVDIYLSHGITESGKLPAERDVKDKIGYVTNPSYRDGKGVFGDLVLNEKHSYYESVKWWADNAPHKIGMSHIASLTYDATENAMTKVNKVHSVDFVGFASTTNGLFSEGVIVDKITKDDDERKLWRILDTFQSLVWSIQYPTMGKTLTQDERAVELVPLVKDLLKEVKALAKVDKAESDTTVTAVTTVESTLAKEQDMELKDITIDMLKQHRKDIVDSISKLAVESHTTTEAKISEAVKAIPEDKRSTVFMRLVREAVVAGDDKLVTELVEDRKVVAPTVAVKAAESAAPVVPVVETKPVTKPVTKLSADDLIAAAKRK